MPSTTYPARLAGILLAALLLLVVAPQTIAQTQPTQATSVPLLRPGGLAYDAFGNLYFAETANHVVRRVSPTGVISTVAGSGIQGFGGDGAAATSAMFDSPLALALDAAGNLYIADSHNHRIRRVDVASGIITSLATQIDLPSALAFDAAGDLYVADQRSHLIRRIDHQSGTVTTVAGGGTQGYSGDGGLATLAAIDSPSGIALDAAGNLYLADTHNHRVRRVDATSGIITSVAGTGLPGFSGTALNLPRGLEIDSSGNLFVVDANNQRVRRIDGVTGQISTIAGAGTQAFAGDSSPAVAAALNTPRAITMSPANLPTLSDAGNQRIRQVDSAAIIHTIAGLGATSVGALTLAGPTVTFYGTGALTATLVASSATGLVTFFDTINGSPLSIGSNPLAANTASLSTSSLVAGPHRLLATYAGDTLHAAAQSSVFSLTISPAPLVATPNAATMLYGQTAPALTGALVGVLPQDSGQVTLALNSLATSTSGPGAYAIVASVMGSAAGNYVLTQSPAALTVLAAPSTTALTNALAVHVATTTSGTPTGTVALLDAGVTTATATLSSTGDATFSAANLSTGTHTLTAVYGGDRDFVGSTSNSAIATVGPIVPADFSLAATGQTAVTIQSGATAQFSFGVNPINGALSSPIFLTVTGLPAGATASFNPSYLPPANTPAAFILTIQTTKTASLTRTNLLVFAMLLPIGLLLRGRRSRRVVLAALVALSMGCGDRVNTKQLSAATATYNVTVIGTATSTTGATLQHSAVVTLTLQ